MPRSVIRNTDSPPHRGASGSRTHATFHMVHADLPLSAYEHGTYKVYLVNMPHATDEEEIKSRLDAMGHKVINITNLKDSRTQDPVNIFFLELERRDNNRDILRVKRLCGVRCEFHPLPKRHVRRRLRRGGHQIRRDPCDDYDSREL